MASGAGHWIDENFQLRTAVLEFHEMHRRHGAKEMAQVAEETVVQWGLEGCCLGFTTDNASSNIAAFRRMSEEGGCQCFFNSRMHFRCMEEWGGAVCAQPKGAGDDLAHIARRTLSQAISASPCERHMGWRAHGAQEQARGYKSEEDMEVEVDEDDVCLDEWAKQEELEKEGEGEEEEEEDEEEES
ncbi:unnamed protein product [Closterium sp. Naga37s-1]|nr:unnamed protein product [Closterium sp. Naga37s-1]